MKRNLIALSLIAVILALPVLTLAQPGKSINDIDTLVRSIKSAAWKIFGIIALVCFVMAGIFFLTAGGDAEKLTTARSAAIWGIAGVIVGILAYSILTFVESLIV